MEELEQELYSACKDGNIEKVRTLLQNPQINIDSQNLEWKRIRESLLLIACAGGHIEVVKLLLNEEGIDLNTVDHYCRTPFYYSCYNGHLGIVKLLNDKGVDYDVVEALFRVCEGGYLALVKFLLASGKEVNLDTKDSRGRTMIDCIKEREERGAKMFETLNRYRRRMSNYPKIIQLLESFARDPNETRFNLRMQLGLLGKIIFISIFLFLFFNIYFKTLLFYLSLKQIDSIAASLFAMTILISDHYLEFKGVSFIFERI